MEISAEQQAVIDAILNEPEPSKDTLLMQQLGSTKPAGKSTMSRLDELLARMEVTFKEKQARDAAKPKPVPALTSVQTPSTNVLKPAIKPITLAEDLQTQQAVVKILSFCWKTLQLYGKKADDFDDVVEMYLNLLADYASADIERAFKKYLKYRTEFPAPASIIGLIEERIKRDGFYYKTLKAKGTSRTMHEDLYVREYEKQALEDWE